MINPLTRLKTYRARVRKRDEANIAFLKERGIEPGQYLKVVGWGPFKLPGEDRRVRQAYVDTIKLLDVMATH